MAQAATVIDITDAEIPDGPGLSFFTDFPAPDGNQYKMITIEFGGLTLNDETKFTGDYQGLYWAWDPGLPGVVSNDLPMQVVECSVGNGCIKVISPGKAVAYYEAPRDVGNFASCGPTSVGHCYEHYGVPSVSSFDGWVTRTGGPAFVRVTFGDATAVPEPTTWALMLAGFFGAGGALRRARRLRSATAFA